VNVNVSSFQNASILSSARSNTQRPLFKYEKSLDYISKQKLVIADEEYLIKDLFITTNEAEPSLLLDERPSQLLEETDESLESSRVSERKPLLLIPSPQLSR
jgi:hypothetical protein